jgi:hypothetical protein
MSEKNSIQFRAEAEGRVTLIIGLTMNGITFVLVWYFIELYYNTGIVFLLLKGQYCLFAIQVTPWHSIVTFQAPDSGVRSVTPSNQGNFWQQDNFILGSRLEHNVYWWADCCTSSMQVTVADTEGRTVVCEAGLVERNDENTGLIVAIGVIGGLLVVVILAATGLIILIRRRREIQLQEIRNLPQER